MNGRVGKYNPAKRPNKVDVLTVEQAQEIQKLAKGFRVGTARAAEVAARNAVSGVTAVVPTQTRRAKKIRRRLYFADPVPSAEVGPAPEIGREGIEAQRLLAQKQRQLAWAAADIRAEHQAAFREFRRKRALCTLAQVSGQDSCSEGQCCMIKGAVYRAAAICSSRGAIVAYTPAELVRSDEMIMLGFAGGSCARRYPALICSSSSSEGEDEDMQSPVQY